ncbi:putative protease IV sppA [Melampsora larici-populina 98AG31]|uniref:Putative protease IV sppA n=1 Tax=Melampsora larici-populina (strain 98AG31 / pathotype 3-4-7) TaxID=747676 RepID=F4S8K0_MELLP|nr:putative protease IV sppA [Melampsora larici-populina 98AG31]EGF99057.1 putative protease IV sppA [Melampsora larici-populina 98AG31]
MESGPTPPEPITSTPPPSSSSPDTKKTSRIRSQWNRLSSSRIGQGARLTYTWRRPILFGVGVSVFIGRYYYSKYQAAKRDFIQPDTYLVWRLYDGAVVEYPSNQTNLSMLLGSSGEGSEPPRVMTLYDAVRTLQFVQADDRIIGLIADMSSTNAPTVSQNIPLGLAQIEELQEALNELKAEKERRLGAGKFKTIAFTETFRSQAEYAMASGFDEIYCQPSGEIPLVGINSTVTFYSRLLNWLGIKVHAEARTDYKSMTPQAENHSELLEDLNRNMLSLIAMNRFRNELSEQRPRDPKEMGSLTERMKTYSKKGPLMAHEAIEMGLISGTTYKEELFEKVMFGKDAVVVDELGEVLQGIDKINAIKDEIKKKTKGFFHYHRIMDRISQRKFKDEVLNVGVVYVLGTIGDVGEFGTGAIVKGLKEAAEDDSIGAVVLRIDSGGGGVVESDTIWGAVKELRSRGKPVIASFGNAAASGGYLIATHADSIFAMPSTITGSIGVASLRPTIMPSFFERLKLTTQSFFTGSQALSIYHELGDEAMSRHKTHIDLAYADFKGRVCDGRQISTELIEKLAGGRVYTGLKAWTLAEDSHRQVTEEKQQSETLAVEPKQESDVNSVSNVDAVTNLDSADNQPHIDIKHPTSLIPPDSELLASSVDRLSEGSASSETSDIQNGEPAEPGPLGRGIIDGIGGIRDAAIHGVELYLARLLSTKQDMEPDKSPAEILQDLLPGVPYKTNEEGHLMMSFDIRLKKFPVHKSFWEQLSAASKKGDGIELSMGSLSATVKHAFVNWMAGAVLQAVETEGLDMFGMQASDLRQLKKLMKDSRQDGKSSSIRAELPPFTFQ